MSNNLHINFIVVLILESSTYADANNVDSNQSQPLRTDSQQSNFQRENIQKPLRNNGKKC